MTDMSKKQVEFFTFLILICTATAALILLIDFQIKAAILEESNRLRRVIEHQSTSANGGGFADNGNHNPDYPADLVHGGNALMEETGHTQGANGQSKKARASRTNPRTDDGLGSIQD